MKSLELKYNTQITQSLQEDQDFFIEGVALNSTITSNNHKFVSEELEKSASTLSGVPLLADHDNSVNSIKGLVLKGEFDEANERINFKARVDDLQMRKLIQKGTLSTVSVGATVEDVEEQEDGSLKPTGITFKELSLVAVPADDGATFGKALKEAYSSSHSEILDTVKKEDNQMSEKEETENVESETSETETSENEETETSETNVDERIDKMEAKLDKILDKLSEADVDEEPKEPQEPEKEPEEEEKEEEEDEDEEVEEKLGYSIIQGHRSFSVQKDKY